MKYCKHCGKEVDDKATVCPNCFGSLGDSNEQTIQPNYAIPEKRKSALVNDEGKAKGGFLFLSLIWFVLGIIFAVSTNSAGYKKASKSYVIATVFSGIIQVALFVISYGSLFKYIR